MRPFTSCSWSLENRQKTVKADEDLFDKDLNNGLCFFIPNSERFSPLRIAVHTTQYPKVSSIRSPVRTSQIDIPSFKRSPRQNGLQGSLLCQFTSMVTRTLRTPSSKSFHISLPPISTKNRRGTWFLVFSSPK